MAWSIPSPSTPQRAISGLWIKPDHQPAAMDLLSVTFCLPVTTMACSGSLSLAQPGHGVRARNQDPGYRVCSGEDINACFAHFGRPGFGVILNFHPSLRIRDGCNNSEQLISLHVYAIIFH